MRVLTALERSVKGALFSCRMCGNCILQETAFVCPMTCAKGLRNGFCGEATEERCVVDSSRPCTWLLIFKRAERLGRLEKLLEINAPIDGAQAGHSTWVPLFQYWAARKQPHLPDLITNPQKFGREWEQFCHEIRQPAWWQADSEYHPAGYTQPVSTLEATLKTNPFVITGEIAPPDDSSTTMLLAKVKLLQQYVVSSNFSDNAFATSRMSSLACSKLSLENGLEPVLQIQCRDRSRNGILSDVMGASALGIRNILCLGGDYHNKGPSPRPYQPEQFDIDSVQMLYMLRRLRDEGKHIDGRELEVRPKYFLGAAGSPFTLKPAYNAIRTEKKINAGAQFIQTQMVFDTGWFGDWLGALEKRSLLGKVHILAGVCPPGSAEDLHSLENEPGISIPKKYLDRMDRAAEKDQGTDQRKFQQTEGISIAVEIIQNLRKIPGISGIHMMVGGNEAILPEVFQRAGLESVL